MKKILTLEVIFLCSMLTALAQFSGSGNGTEESPYLIFNVTQLSQLSNFGGQSGVVFRLMKDIDLSEWIRDNNPRQGWTPIGVAATPFKGVLKGENHKITGLSINRASESYVGFFGYLSGATISNLTLEGSDVTGSSYVGTFAGYATSSTITNCHIKLTGKVSSSSGSYIGGFFGTAFNCTISDFSTEVTVFSTGASYVGGFAGSVSEGSTLSDGTVNSDVTSNKPYTGGFTGTTQTATITDVKVTSNVKGTTHVGGFIGKSDAVDNLTCCTYMGNLMGQENIGGISAFLTAGSNSTFTSCFSKGRITATGDYVGGIVGVSQGGCIGGMESCSHFGDIVGGSHVGGLIGVMHSTSEASPQLNTYSIVYMNNKNVVERTFRTVTESITTGSTVAISVKNNVVVGNIVGRNNIGGLVGKSTPSYGYTAQRIDDSYSSSTYDLDLLKNGVKTGISSTWWIDEPLRYSYYNYKKDNKSIEIVDSYFSGNIHGQLNVGGIVGEINGSSIKRCYSYASITGTTNVGGLLGNNIGDNTTIVESNISNNYLIAASESAVGRIFGSATNVSVGALGSTQGNRSLVTTKVVKKGILQEVNDDLQNGTSIGATALKLKATYGALGWNYDSDWNQLETESYPYKKYQAAPPTITSPLESQATTISGKSVNGGTVYLYYKDREPVSTVCNSNDWSFTTEPLQSGAQVQVYADAEGMTPSYFTTANVGYPGEGTEEAPYLIYSAEDLQGVNKSGYYKLKNDIDLTAWINENSPAEGWPAIGMNGSEAVYIDGDYHKITGLWTNTTKDFNGLFSSFLIGQIKNLTVEVAAGKKVKGGDYTGILIGYMANARIVNCTVKGDVEGTLHVGGIAAATENTDFSNCHYDGSVTTSAENAYAGGLVGQAQGGSIASSDALGSVTGSLCVGGVAGHVKDAELNTLAYSGNLISSANEASIGGIAGKTEGCALTGGVAMPAVTSTGATASVGGVIGNAVGGTITKSVANDNISTSGTGNYVGGLVGYSEADISESNANGAVSATGDNSYTGGLVGYAKGSVTNSYSSANVTGTQYTAGLVANTFSSIDKCYAKGNIIGQFYGGGIVANMDGASASTTNCVAMNGTLSLTAQTAWACRVIGGYGNGCADPNESNYALNTMQVSLNGIPTKKYDDIMEGISKKQSELMQTSTYSGLGWNFTKVWGISEGASYPYLLWEIDANPVAEVRFDKTTLVIAVDKTGTINATVLPVGATNKRLKWTSSNPDVASVKDGVVTAFEEGETTITATSTDGSNVSASCKVKVVPNIDALIAELQALIDEAQSLYDDSTEGSDVGQYANGSRAALLVAIENVSGRISDAMSAEDVSECMAILNDAISVFEAQKVMAGEDTDISKMENVIYINRMEVSAGSQATISVKMKNSVIAEGFGFDLYLPEGISILKDEDGFAEVELSKERTTAKKTNNFDFAFQSDGSLRVFGYSTNGSAISGNDGEIVTINVEIADNMRDGEYPVILRNVTISDDESVSHDVDYVKSTIAVSSYMIGDANNDGQVNVTDLTAIAHHILGNTPNRFNEKAADANSDGNINVTDLTATAHLILYGTITSPKKSRRAKALYKMGVAYK